MIDLNDSIQIILRTGTVSDPYVDMNHPGKVQGGFVYLTEIPVKMPRVIVEELDGDDLYEVQNANKITENTYYIDYKVGIAYFHPSREGQTLNFTYKGRGYFLLSGSRIFTELDENGNVVKTLNDLIEEMQLTQGDYIEALDAKILEATNKINETENTRQTLLTDVNTAIDNAETATDLANQANLNTQAIVSDTKFISSYNASTAYKKNNMVSYNGHSFIAKQDTTGNTPPDPTLATENAYWGLQARKGNDGTGTVNRPVERFISTEGQDTFVVQYPFDQNQNRVDVIIEGVPQDYLIDFTEPTSTSIRTNEPLPAGYEVIVKYFRETIPLAGDIQTNVDNLNNITSDHAGRITDSETELVSVTQQLAETNEKNKGVISVTQSPYSAKGDWNGTTGTDDTTAIKNALSDAVSQKKSLYFPEGLRFLISDQIVLNGEVELFFGENAELISNYSPATTTEPLVKVDSNNVTITNIKIDGRDNVHRGINCNGFSNVRIMKGLIKNVGMVGVNMESTTNLLIRDVETNKCMYGGDGQIGSIRIADGSNATIQRCIVKNSSGKGIAIERTDTALIKDCIIYDTQTDAGDAIYLGYICKNVTVDGCRVVDPLGNAIKLSRGASNCVVQNCVFTKTRNNVAYAALIQGVVNSIFSGNRITVGNITSVPLRIEDHPDPQGSNCVDITVRDNQIKYEGTGAVSPIEVRTRGDSGSPYTCKNVSILYNRLKGGSNGILVTNVNNVDIEGNTVEGMSAIGISVTGTTTNEVNTRNNKIFAAKGTGISYYMVTSGSINDNTIMADATTPPLFGIQPGTGAKNITISKNRVKGFASRQIMVADTAASGIIISENILDCISNGSQGFEFRGVSARLVNNFILNATTKYTVLNTNTDIIVSGNGA